jgi:two-component sensor histidine kinase
MDDQTGPRPDPLTDAIARNVALLHEVDHRVKNNLQLIASLLVLQSRREDDPAVRAALTTILGRVNAVAVVHRRLFQDDPLQFDVAAFLRDLVDDRGGDRVRVAVRVEAERALVPTGWAAPLALAVNELLTNSLAHAFPNGRSGRLTVSLSREHGVLRIGIADDGVGIPADFIDGFGLTIVRLLCRQLKAEFEMQAQDPGVRATISLREPAR